MYSSPLGARSDHRSAAGLSGRPRPLPGDDPRQKKLRRKRRTGLSSSTQDLVLDLSGLLVDHLQGTNRSQEGGSSMRATTVRCE